MDQVPDLRQLMKLAQSPAGQQLLRLLKQQDGSTLDAAAKKAASGDYTQALEALSGFLNTPEAKALLAQLEDTNG